MNKVELMGRLANEVEVRYGGAANDIAVAKFALAVERRFKKEGQKNVDFIQIIAFGKQGEFCQKFFKKGQQICLCGRIQTRSWDDNDGSKRWSTEVIADEFYFCGKKEDKDEGLEGFQHIDELEEDDLPF